MKDSDKTADVSTDVVIYNEDISDAMLQSILLMRSNGFPDSEIMEEFNLSADTLININEIGEKTLHKLRKEYLIKDSTEKITNEVFIKATNITRKSIESSSKWAREIEEDIENFDELSERSKEKLDLKMKWHSQLDKKVGQYSAIAFNFSRRDKDKEKNKPYQKTITYRSNVVECESSSESKRLDLDISKLSKYE